MPTKLTLEHDKEHYLPFGERDRSLLSGEWPNMAGLGAEWELSEDGSHPQRQVKIKPPDLGGSKGAARILRESILRFPSAPLFATHDAREHAYKVEESWPNYHTMRVLTRRDLSKAKGGARHVFLLHNGLNETRDISFHYRLAKWILEQRQDAACIIRPLPAHLNRYFFQSPFAELPLDEYLQDPAAVFRQFLRYMQETQWLLSTLVPRHDYEIATGCELLLYGTRPGRSDDEALATEIRHQANRMLRASKERSREAGSHTGNYSKEKLEQGDVLDCVRTLRHLLGWSPADPSKPPREGVIDRPAIHAVGYSMGGFVAQSIFCAWPFAVSSCSNLFAGGALRDLAPTAFAHPQEWQSVLHGLRSELDYARIKDRFDPAPLKKDNPEGPKYVLGIKRRTFDYYERIFENVFLQSDRGSYSTRLAEFSRRLLFVLGGDDPIVRTRNVLDAAPPGGITLHQIGDVSHFQDSKQKEPAELEQRDFWLPQAGGMIGRFAERAASLLQKTNSVYWRGAPPRPAATGEKFRRNRPADGVLANMQFEQELDSMLDMLKEPDGGWVFIARNQIPTVFLDEETFRAHAAAMHHSEDLIGDYADGLRARAERLAELRGGFSLLIPSAQVLRQSGEQGAAIKPPDTARDRAMFSKSEVAIRYWPDQKSRMRAWDHFSSKWCQGRAVHQVEENEYPPEELGTLGEAWHEVHRDSAEQIAVTMLPDVWVGMSQEACEKLFRLSFDLGVDETEANERQEAVERHMVRLARKLVRKEEAAEKDLHSCLAAGTMRMVKVSPAELNPRFRGRLLDDSSKETSGVGNLLIHWAMAYEASSPVTLD